MTEPEPTQEKTIVPKREVRVVVDDSDQAHLLDTARFEQIWRVAGAFAASNLIPKHLREDKHGEFSPDTVRANVFLVINQALRWGFDPIGLFRETYVVGGVLGYQGKLVTAVINARAGLKRNLDFEFHGKPGTPEFMVVVIGTFKTEDDPRTVSLSVAQAKTQNDIWVRDPEQKLCYSGAIKWARRHAPEIVLGVLTEDDVDKIAASDAKPARAKVVEKPVFSPSAKCDGNHGEPPCSDPECWLLTVMTKPLAPFAKNAAEHEDNRIIQEYLDTLPEDHPHKKGIPAE